MKKLTLMQINGKDFHLTDQCGGQLQEMGQ